MGIIIIHKMQRISRKTPDLHLKVTVLFKGGSGYLFIAIRIERYDAKNSMLPSFSTCFRVLKILMGLSFLTFLKTKHAQIIKEYLGVLCFRSLSVKTGDILRKGN
jgi:hypothetical protein